MFIWTHPATNAHGLSIFHERWISWNNFHGQEVIYIGDIWPYRSSFHSFHSPQSWMPDLEGPVKEPQFSSTIPQKMDARILMAMSPKDTSNLNLFGALAHLGADMDADMDAVSGGFALTYVWPMFGWNSWNSWTSWNSSFFPKIGWFQTFSDYLHLTSLVNSTFFCLIPRRLGLKSTLQNFQVRGLAVLLAGILAEANAVDAAKAGKPKFHGGKHWKNDEGRMENAGILKTRSLLESTSSSSSSWWTCWNISTGMWFGMMGNS